MIGALNTFKGLVVPESFTVSSSTQSIQVDHPYQILYTILPANTTNPTVIWESSDTSIAIVDSTGLITPVSVGECTITGHMPSNRLMQIINVTTYVVHTTGVSLDKNSIMVLPDTSVQLTATVIPSNTNFPEVIWSSSNTSVATVDNNGLVSYASVGNCTITCTTVDGGYIDICDVETGIPVESVSLDIHNSILYSGDTVQLTATVLPVDASNKNVTWSSSNTNVATVTDDGLVTFVGTGNCIITVTTAQGGFTDTCSISCQTFQPVDKCFGYTGAQQSISLKPHKYCLEVWGAQGGTRCGQGGKGGYSAGTINLSTETTLYILVGGCGGTGANAPGGWNGGGCGCSNQNRVMTGGGGGTDIRIGGCSIYHRRIVAGGGGGGTESYNTLGGYGGGITGGRGYEYGGGLSGDRGGSGGTQTAGGAHASNSWDSSCSSYLTGKFGRGGGTSGISTQYKNGGGGGWYGGGAGGPDGGSGGGSGYTYTSSTCSSAPSGYCHCTAYFLTNAVTCCGAVSFPTPSGSTETGHSGNGCVRIRSI